MDPDPGGSPLLDASNDVADCNGLALRHGKFAKRMAIDVTVVRDLTALRAIESEWRGLASVGGGGLFRGPDWMVPWWSAYHATLGAELHVLVGRATEADTTGVAVGTQVAVGVEAYDTETIGAVTKEWAQSPTAVKFVKLGFTSATTGNDAPSARRQITDNAKCNKCHLDLGFHGGEARKIPEYCAFCHNSRNVNDERTSQFEAPFSKTPGTVQLSVMIHKIHKGSEMVPSGSLPNPRPTYTLGATRDFRADPAAIPPRAEGEAPPVEFAGAFPGDLKNCLTCHVAGGYGLPESNVLPTRSVTFTCTEDPADDLNEVCGTLSGSGGVIAPDSAAGDAYWSKAETYMGSGQAHCGSCHDSTAAVTHFTAMTINNVESCDVCHGDSRILDPIEIHQARP